jgi:hypothetical protein
MTLVDFILITSLAVLVVVMTRNEIIKYFKETNQIK